MRELEVLFGCTFPVDAVTICVVHRTRLRGASAIVAGSEPTKLRLVLRDGRAFEASARARGPQRAAIDAVIAALAEHKAGEALRALVAGSSTTFGPVEVTPEGIRLAGRATRWEDVGGWAVRSGGLVWDDAKGALAGEVRLAELSFADALCRVFAARLPAKDYDAMRPGDGPRPGFFTVSARRRIPGTFKHGRHLLAALALPLVLLFLGNFVVTTMRNAAGEKAGAAARAAGLARIDAATRALDDGGTRALPVCRRDDAQRARLVDVNRTAVSYFDGIWFDDDLGSAIFSDRVFVWRKEDAIVRVVLFDGVLGRSVCHATKTIREGALHAARDVVEGRLDAPPVAVSSAVPASVPVAAPKRAPRRETKRRPGRAPRP